VVSGSKYYRIWNKFIVLFVVALILFVILLPFNAILLFTRTLSKHKFVNHFKALLDVYQTRYKMKCYYWVGLHLLIKALFYALSSLEKNTNLTVGVIMLHTLSTGTEYIRPFKCWIQNCNEMMLFFLSIVYAISLSQTSCLTIDVMLARCSSVHFDFCVSCT